MKFGTTTAFWNRVAKMEMEAYKSATITTPVTTVATSNTTTKTLTRLSDRVMRRKKVA